MLYRHIVRPVLFRLAGGDPEYAHEWAIRLLTALGRQPAALRLVERAFAVHDARLRQDLLGLTFPNPVGLAAGFDKNAVALPALAALGFGFIEAGTVTRHPQSGNPRPRIQRLPEHDALINSMGFNNDGAATVARRLARSGPRPVPLGVSLGKSKVTPLEDAVEDYRASLRLVYPYADYVAVNVSSPNTPGLRALQERDQIDALLGALTRESAALGARQQATGNRQQRASDGRRRVPLLVKISPDLSDEALDELLDVGTGHHIDGIIAVNTTIRMRNAECGMRNGEMAARPGPHSAFRIPHSAFGLSGRPLRARALAVVRHIARRTGGALPVIGVGGIFSAEDAYAMIQAGASLVQVYTGFVYEGPALVRRINRGLLRLMARDGVRRLAEVRGQAFERERVAAWR
jgi:dihydroorotate dehydrogenase